MIVTGDGEDPHPPERRADHDRPPDTIVLVHGLWMTPRSWEHWVPYYEAKGFRVLTPTYPGFEVEVEALRENPDVDRDVTVPETVDHLAERHRRPRPPPIIMGHSFGGTLTQLLLPAGSAPPASSSIRRRPRASASTRCRRSGRSSPR